MAEVYTGKVAFQIERERLYAIPDDVQDNLVNPDLMRTVNWIDDAPDDENDGSGHWELVPEAEDTFPMDQEVVGSWSMDHQQPQEPTVE